ncbi:MAG TPA: hypothetical protein VIL88_14660 [Devosia sp.]|jgi:hypothetical protein|uniref:hypothetical protein n=1 Tax=Devosia sp. TaxID=1871048 RepID=UPI002F93170E
MKHPLGLVLPLLLAAPAAAADYFGTAPDLRPAYPQDWALTDDSPLRFESGLRYWYSVGTQEHNVSTYSQRVESKSSSAEIFARVEDLSTQTFLEATGGYGIAHQGSYSTNGGASVDLPAARLGYVGADFGWLPLGSETGGVGFLAGYQYTNDSPDTGRGDFLVTPTVVNNGGGFYSLGGGGDSKVNDFNVHSLKLGFTGKADMGTFDILGEAAAIPYSWVTGTYGGFSIPATPDFEQASEVSINGHGYGASGKLMVGFHPTENFTIRVGGRASYLTGQYDANFDTVSLIPAGGGAPTLSRQRYIINNNPFSMIRYGALLELSGRF